MQPDAPPSGPIQFVIPVSVEKVGRVLASLAVLAVFAAVGCGPAFEPEARLTKLRVLAIRAEPMNPLPGAVTVLEPLVYGPPDGSDQAFTYSWSWCPVVGVANDGYACRVGDAQLQQLGADLGVTGIPPLSLGTERTQPFGNPFPTSVLSTFCSQWFAGTFPDCAGGFPIRLKVTVSHAGAVQTATTIVRLPLSDTDPVNSNPAFDLGGPALVAIVGGVEEPIDAQATAVLPRLKETDVRARVADAEAESYMGTGDDGKPALLRERLVLTWFVETGDVVPDFHTGYFPGQTELDALLANKWKPGSTTTYAPDKAQLIVVLRDSRGGVAWTSGSVTLESAP